MTTGRSYPINLAGTPHFQEAIGALAEGDVVQLLREPSNAFDARAIAAIDAQGQTIGYVPRDCWLQRAVHEEGESAEAEVAALWRSTRGFLEVKLQATITEGPMGEK